MNMNDQKRFEKDKHQQRAADGLENFILYISSPWRVIWVNFLAGMFKGLGTIVGASIVIALIIWVLSLFKQIPFLGSYAKDMEAVVEGYIHETNYNDELGRVAEILERIEESLKEPKTPPPSE
jgi:hypothetical protein